MQRHPATLPDLRGLSWQLKLVICVVVDLIGMASYALPGLGEMIDVFWAPISAALVHSLFHMNAMTAVAFAEELLPFTDFVPSACIAWALENRWVFDHLRRSARRDE